MRKHVLLLVSLAAMLLTSMFSMAQAVYFTDGFEDGLSPQWTQEYYDVNTGTWITETPDVSQPWKAESGTTGDLAYPNGAAVGKGRAYFRQEAAPGKNVQTTGYKTRLITPKMDLNGYQPILRFYHAQAKWTADFDTLRVYYRQDESPWELLSEYTSPIQKWKFEEIDLPLTGVNYQIAFEANENMGRGIVLDSVIIRTKPQITTPHDMNYYDMRDNGINLTWEASKDADSFRVIVAEMNLDLNVIPTNIDSTQYIVVDTLIDSDLAQDIRVKNLASGRTYYMQVQSIGEFENSVWSETFSFRMKPVVNITATQGYFEDFTIPYKSNKDKDNQLETWTWGGDFAPVIPMYVGNHFDIYSPDASPAVTYTGPNSNGAHNYNTSTGVMPTSLPAGMTSYIVSPEISGKDIPGFSMSMCHVTFWGTTYTYQHDRAKAIIVGIVSDPEDPTTFVAIDTCEVWGCKQFTWFDVDLSSYTGDGRYVAFVSNFQDKANWFALDKVTIELKPAVSAIKASDIKVIPTITEAQLSWPAAEDATSYKVKYVALEDKGKKVPLTEGKMAGAVTVTTSDNAMTLSGLTANTKYVYSVQVVDGENTGAWSQPREFYTSASIEIPKTYEFEEGEGIYRREGEDASEMFQGDWYGFSNNADAPYLDSSNPRTGTRCLYLQKDQYNDAWAVAPMMDDVKQVEMVFYARQYGTSSATYPESNVVVGVMEDPSDLKTFTPIATCTPADILYERFYVNFLDYQGAGKYIALLWGESGLSKNAIRIDDLTIRPVASCFASTIDVQATDSNAILRWNKPDEAYRYSIKVSKTKLVDDKIATTTGSALLVEKYDYADDTLLLSNLNFSTTYYVYSKTVCSATDESDWVGMSFTTPCPQTMKLPYKTSFEDDETGTIPACWTKPIWTTTTSTYPSVSTTNYHGQGGKSLYMYSYTTYGSTIALPPLDANLEDVKLRFWLYYSSASDYKVMVGVMSDLTDPNDFYPTDTFKIVGGEWVLCEAMFTAEDLSHGSYLALSSFTGAANYVYVDDVEVINLVNEAPFNYKKVDAGTSWFEVAWDGKTTDKWDIIVSKSCYAMPDSLADKINPADSIPAADIIANTQTATNGYKVEDGLQSLTWYYLYAKSSAGTKWSMDSIQTECTVWNPRVKQIQGFETDANGNVIRSTTSSMSTTAGYVNNIQNAKVPECWTVGNVLDGTDFSKLTSSGYIPYICTDGVGSGKDPSTLKYAENSATTNQYSTNGVNSLKVYSYYSSSASSNRAPAWAAMNKLECSDEDLKSLILTFDYAMATSTAANPPAIVIGIMDDPTDLSTFVVLDSIPASKASGTGSHKHKSVEIALEDYQGTGRYIAFRGRYGVSSTFYLDNVSVSLATCPNPKPSISQIRDNSAVVNSGLRVDNSWQYIVTDSMYQSENLDAGQMPDAQHIVTQAQVVPKEDGEDAPKMDKITGLDANKTYYVYVSTLCENNEISAWKMVDFKTLCAPTDAADWVGNFESDTTVSGYRPECWTVGSLTASAADSYIPYVVSTTRKEIMDDPDAAKVYSKEGVVTGAKVLRMYAYSTTSVGSYAISPAIQVAEGKMIQDYQVMFKGYGTSSQSGYTTTSSYAHNLRVGMATDPSDLSTVTILDTVSLPTNTQQCAVELSNYQGNGQYIVFLLEKEAPTYSYAFIYDIHLDLIPACKVPGGITLDTIGDTFMKASWNGNAAQYKVAISKVLYTDAEKATYFANDSVIAKDGIIFKATTENSITFDGLKPNTGYYLYVQGICGENDTTVWSYEVPGFRTECPYDGFEVPYFTDFDDNSATGSGNKPDCWTGVYLTKDTVGSSQSYPYVYTSYAYSGKNDMYMYSSGSSSTSYKNYAVLPSIKGSLNEYQLSFFARKTSSTATTYGSKLLIGYVTNAEQKQIDPTFVVLDSVEVTAITYEQFNINFDTKEAIPAGARLAFKADWTRQVGLTASTKYANFYIDNVRVREIPTCYAPKNLVISEESLSSAKLDFVPANASSNKWQIELTKVGDSPATYVVEDTTYTFTGLDHSSSYSVRVRTLCGEDESEYSDPVIFNTKWMVDTYTWSFKMNEQGTVSVPHKAGAAVATYTLHPALTSTGSQATLNYSSNTTYLPYQIANTGSLAYAEDKRDFVAGGDTARALRLYRYYSTSYAYGDSAAVILPSLLNPQGKQMSFDVRFGYAYASNHSTATYQNVVSNTYPKSFLCIGTVDSLQTDLSTYQEITRVYAHPMIANDTLRAASNYGWMHYVLPLDMNLAGKQLVVMIQAPATAYICIDNLAIEAIGAEGSLATPVISSVNVGDTYATLNWTGDPEISYNIYVVDTTKAACGQYYPYIQDAPAACVDTIKNVSGNSYKVTGLVAGGSTYEFYVEVADKAAMNGALSNRVFATTVCEATDASNGYSYDFEPGPNTIIDTNPSKSKADGFTFQWPMSTTAGDTVYKTPECWNYGIDYSSYDKTSTTYKSYNPTLKSNTASYVYSRNGYSCMQFYGSSTYKEVYAVMPLMTGYDPDTMEVNFWGRSTYETTKGLIYTTSYLKGTSYSTKLAVGTMTDPEDPATFVALDTIEYDYTANDMIANSTEASADPAGNRYWLNFTVPMAGATGSYVAFKQVGYGYFYMDDLTLQKRQTARRPRNLEVIEAGSTTATVTWTGMEEGGSYEIQLSTSKSIWTGAQTIEVTKDTFTFEGLAVATEYFFRVKQKGSEYGDSEYAHYESFRTECLALNPNGYKTGFEGTITDPYMVVPGATGTNVNTMKQNQCWTYWNMGTTQTVSTTYFPYNIGPTATVSYAHSGSYALKLYATSTTAQTCVVSPEINAEIGEEGKGFDTLQISFWACPSPHGIGTSSYLNQISTASGTTYAKYIEIGTCTDPADPSTYTVLQGWTYQVEGDNLKTKTQADENNNYAFQKVTVKLNGATGKYVFIRANRVREYGDGATKTYSTMYIDDLQFEKLLNCPTPENLEAVDVTTLGGQLQWTGEAMSYDIQISTDPTFTDEEKLVADVKNLETTVCALEPLAPATQYYYRVKAYCDAEKKDASDWTIPANFTTPKVPMYEENFTNDLGEWRLCYGYADKVFAGKATPRDTTNTGTYNSWYRILNNIMSGYAVRMLLNYSTSSETYYQKYWLISPSITLEKDSAQLTFLAALANNTTTNPITADSHWNEGWDDQFMVIVSEDDGKTWKRENATIWNNETSNNPEDAHYKYGIGDYVLTDIPAKPTRMYIDLGKYTGKTIRVAFYAENTVQNAKNAIHVDNPHINYYVAQKESIELCQYEDIENVLGFSINGDTVSAGEKKLERYVLGYKEGVKDSLYSLDVNYLEAPQYYYEMTVCAGHPFEYMGFNQHTKPGTYRMKLKSQVTGCDSIVNFVLKHAETLRTTIDTTICYGTSYEFNGKVYSKAGSYSDTLQACEWLGGCDSIVTLNLTVTDSIHTVVRKEICKSDSFYYWKEADRKLTEMGTYRYIFDAANGCDSIVDLTLVINDTTWAYQYATIKEGHEYNWYGEVYTESGIHDKVSTSQVTHCDSITRLVLTVIPAPIDTTNAALCAGGSYEFYGKYYNELGVYTDTTYNEEHDRLIHKLFLLTENPIKRTELGTVYINEGDEYDFNGKMISEKGDYYDTVPSVETGCDSINHIYLNPLAPAIYNMPKTVCASELPFQWKDTLIEKEGTYTFDTLTVHGTDSIINLTLNVIQPTTATIRASFCEGGNYELNGETYSAAGTYYQTLKSKVTGCDSIITLVLTQTPATVIPVSASFCEGSSYSFGVKELTEAGTYRDTTYTEGEHCMQITELHLSMTPRLYNNMGTEYINLGEKYEFYGKQLETSGTYYDTVPSLATGCDSINYINLVVLTDFTGHESQTVCANELPITWKGQTLDKADTYQFDTLTVYGTDSIVVLTLNVIQPTTATIRASFCEGGSYELNGETYSAEGTYYQTLKSKVTGCDSIITLVLTQTPATVIPVSASFCEGSSYSFGGKELTEAGTYRDTTYTEGEHCMQITELHLSMTPRLYNNLGTKYINAGSEYNFNGKMISTAGRYYDTVQSVVTGCDSINYLYLNPLSPRNGSESMTVCSSELPITWKKKVIESAGTYTFDTLTVYGTDSIITLTLNVIQPVTYTINDNFCEGGSYELNGETYSAEGTYYQTLKSKVTGCDSIITLVLTPIPAPVEKISAAICNGSSYPFGGKNLTRADIYRDTTYEEGMHCMKITELTLIVNYPVNKKVNANICAGDQYQFGDTTLATTGVYTRTLTSVTGCDSIVTLTLSVSSVQHKSIGASICRGESYPFGGKELTEAAIYYDTIQSKVTGCDSLITELTLTVKEPTTYDYDYVLCAGGTYDFFGEKLTEAGAYSHTISNKQGCDSIITVHITISEPLKGTKYAEYCGDAYVYEEGDGNEYTEGTHEVLLKTEAGCDSIVTLTLKQTFDVHDTLNVTMCAGDTYQDENFTVDKPGTYFYEETQMSGCTYYHVLYFDNYPTEMSIDTTVLIEDLPSLVLAIPAEYKAYADSIVALITEPGDYKDSIEVQTPAGCDFTIFVTLHVKDAMAIRDIYEDENGQKVLKVLYRERLYIIRQDGWYNAAGQRVENPIR